MDFFQHQDKARRNTKLLLALYAAAVISIVLLTNLLVIVVSGFFDSASLMASSEGYDWGLFLMVSMLVILLIGLGSLYRIHSLSKGGSVVAEMLDGQLLIDPHGSLEKRRLLNVVEEMAIAAGTPVPPVYIIPDESINAFAAGYSPGDAIIGVTEGALQNLSRDQLQGVIAHEFSHILNGDMRLNIRLMGVLYGILMLAVIGRIVLNGSRFRSSSKRNGSAILAVGLGLLILGYLGKFFGALIKAAVSRQREYLADASAVQFTRYPRGISGALKRIGGYPQGTVLANPESEEISHAFFCSGVNFAFGALMSTHPPLADRIKRLEPNWNGEYLTHNEPDQSLPTEGAGPLLSSFAGAAIRINADAVFQTMGQPGGAQLSHARSLLALIPNELLNAARETFSARAIVYLLLLDQDTAVRQRQLNLLQNAADAAVLQRLHEILPLFPAIEPIMRLPLLEIAMPALRQMTRVQYEAFKTNIHELVIADQKMSLSEWALQKFVTKHLGEAFDGAHRRPKYKGYAAVRDQCAQLLSVLAYTDVTSTTDPQVAFAVGQELLGLDIELVDKTSLSLNNLNACIDTLAELRPLLKPRLLKACVATITADGIATPVEVELVRTVADSLDCPMPPVVV
ncbi:M48 family metallopeptidase [Pseudomonadales bacterium]|nr:M48 family metallopeptidase [Pseudomonadales bacterium]MDC0013709.1 M48 family metallopeptidase [Pseudomonadales bacterium]